MKRRIVFVIFLVGAAWVAGRMLTNSGVEVSQSSHSGQEEINESYQLSPGAHIEVKGINGPVTFETTDSDVAEVHIVRTATHSDDLARVKIVIDQSPENLSIRSEQRGGSSLWKRLWSGGGRGEIKTDVRLKIPRRSEVSGKGINGAVTLTGALDGGAHIKGVNGRVELGEVAGYTELKGINGSVSLALAGISNDGVRLKGINGSITLRLSENLNADFEANGLNGKVVIDEGPNVQVTRKLEHSKMRARIGAGGPAIELSGINGGLRFETIR